MPISCDFLNNLWCGDAACLQACWLNDLSDPWSCNYTFADFEVSSESIFYAADMKKKLDW